jgi:PDZ domain
VLVDTGCNTGVSIEHKLFEKLVLKKRIAIDGVAIDAGVGRTIESRRGILDRIEIGEFELRNLKVEPSLENSVGLGFLERFETELDFPNLKAYFRHGKSFHLSERHNLSEFGVALKNEKLTVVGVRGVAKESGIELNDVVTQINGRPASSLSISKFRVIQTEPDTELKLTLERDGKPYQVALKLKRKPDPFSSATREREFVGKVICWLMILFAPLNGTFVRCRLLMREKPQMKSEFPKGSFRFAAGSFVTAKRIPQKEHARCRNRFYWGWVRDNAVSIFLGKFCRNKLVPA